MLEIRFWQLLLKQLVEEGLLTLEESSKIIEEIAKEKIGNMLQTEKNFLRKSYQNKAAVAQEQIKWIGKGPDELVIWDSAYRKDREERLKLELLKIQGYSLDELSKAKENIATEFRRDILSEIICKNTSFAQKKLEKICEMFGLVVITEKDSSGKNLYSIKVKD